MLNTPRDYEIDHEDWYSGQLESIRFVENSPSPISVVQADTGLGKSCIAKAMCTHGSTVVLTHTISLQESNYKSIYGFDVLKGKGNYPCPLLTREDHKVNANLCIYPKVHECEEYKYCKYARAKNIAINSNHLSLNYTLWFMSKRFHNSKRNDYLILDEAHQLPDLLVSFSSLTITQKECEKMGMSNIDIIINENTDTKTAVTIIHEWLQSSINLLEDSAEKMKGKIKYGKSIDSKLKTKYIMTTRMLSKLQNIIGLIEAESNAWYIRATFRYDIKIQPYTSRFFANRLMFDHAKKVILMSATIGSEVLTELGIDADFFSHPGWIKPNEKPVFFSKDYPRVNHNMFKPENVKVLKKWCEVTKKFIGSTPGDWSSIIHFNSNRRCEIIATQLSKMINRPITLAPNMNTGLKLAWWLNYERNNPGAIIITPSFPEGVNLPNTNINICGDIPFGPIGNQDSYGFRRMKYNRAWYDASAANIVIQRIGRNRRGDPSHYGSSAKKLNIIATPFGRVKRFFNKSFMESIVTI